MGLPESTLSPPELSTRRKEAILALMNEGLLPADLQEIATNLSTRIDGVRAGVKAVGEALSVEQEKELLATLQGRFEANPNRHPGLTWATIEEKLRPQSKKLLSLFEMEKTGGEPDVVGVDAETGEILFFDCAKESPAGRRNLVFDKTYEDWFRETYPDQPCDGNAVDRAAEMGVEILDSDQFLALLRSGEVNLHSWDWLKSPADSRLIGGANCGYKFVNGIRVEKDYKNLQPALGGFRAVLRV